MQKCYLFTLIILSNFLFAQQTISFENSEGFSLGDINGQNDWEVTESSSGFLENQIVSNEKASEGSYSYKNSNEPDYGWQWLPIFGIAKTFDTPLAYNGLTISYDILVTEQLGADFEFTAFGIDSDDNFAPVAGIGMEYQGRIYIIINEDYNSEIANGATWNVDEWYNIKIEISETEIKYYLDNNLIYTGNNFTQLDVHGINLLHNNYGGDAYYDNLVITPSNMGVNDFSGKADISIYPNPIKDFIEISLPSNQTIVKSEVYTLNGQKIIENKGNKKLNLSSLNKGVYVLKVTTNHKTYSKKIIKK